MTNSFTCFHKLENVAKHPFIHCAFGALALSSLSGCASWVQPFFYRPVVEDNIKGLVSTVSLSADRRTVLVITDTDSEKKGLFCAEPPPDSATSLAAQADLSVFGKKTGIAEAGLSGRDQFGTAVTVMADRTPSLDGFRIGIYALCQYRINGMIENDDEFINIFKLLINSFSENVKAEASRTPRPIYVGAPPPLDKSPLLQSQKPVEDEVKK